MQNIVCFFISSFFFSIADLIEQRIYWTDYYLDHIKSAKLDGSDAQLITSGLHRPLGIDVHNNDIYFTEISGKLYKQSKSPGSSKIQLHSDTPNMFGVIVYENDICTYNVIKLLIITLVSSFPYLLLNTLNNIK
jgi:hypothetical protein